MLDDIIRNGLHWKIAVLKLINLVWRLVCNFVARYLAIYVSVVRLIGGKLGGKYLQFGSLLLSDRRPFLVKLMRLTA